MQFLAWPAVALVLGIVGIFVFRQPLIRFLDRAQKIGKEGIQAIGNAQKSALELKQPSPADEFFKGFDNALLIRDERLISEELDKQKIGAGPERERVLLRIVAAQALVSRLENANRVIWGSQLSTLFYLNSSGPANTEALVTYYQDGQSRQPGWYQNYSFDQWLGFLEAASLVSRTGATISITMEGREFLKYIIDQRYSLSRLG